MLGGVYREPSPVSTDDPGQRGDYREMAVGVLHKLSPVLTVGRPRYVIDCVCQVTPECRFLCCDCITTP